LQGITGAVSRNGKLSNGLVSSSKVEKVTQEAISPEPTSV